MDDDLGLEAQLTEARRELAMREGVYPRWIDDGKITARLADRRIRLMQAIIETLQGCLDKELLL